MTEFDARPRGIYRARDGILAGVCKGMADRFDFSVVWLRILVLAAMFFTGFWPVVIAYAIAAFVMKPAPVIPPDNHAEAEFYECYASSSELALRRLKATFDKLERRLRRLEHVITTREFDWDRRLRND